MFDIFYKKPKIVTNADKIDNILSRGVEDVFIKEDLRKKLLSGKELRVKFGIDPTGPNLHIGHAVVLRKLKDFQDLGHKIIFIVGDFTAQIGDPSDKLEKRPFLSKEDIKENLKTYKEQAGRIIDFKKADICFNSKWLSKLNFYNVCELAESFSVQQMSNRRNFKKRIEIGSEVSLREFLYPLMQGYDSVAVKADVEVSGFDQLFNLKAGRVIQRKYNMPEQDVLTCRMLEGLDGRKMSKSWGNVLNITDSANDMFGKVMSINDDLIEKYFTLCTNKSIDEINKIKEDIEKGQNPMEAKMLLAEEITSSYHKREKARSAKNHFLSVFSEKNTPNDEEMPRSFAKKGVKLFEVLLDFGIISSKGEFRRLIKNNSIKSTSLNKIVEDMDYSVKESESFKIGKRRFLRVEIKN